MTRTRFVFALVLAAASVVFLPARAFACSCVPPPGNAKALADADAVFSGTVTEIVDANEGAEIVSSADPLEYVFDVDAVAKGDVEPEQSLYTSRDGASCGFGFTTGKRYLVFAYEAQEQVGFSGAPEGSLETNLCTRTHQLGSDEELPFDAQILGGTGGGGEEAPAPGIPEVPTDVTNWIPMAALAAAVAVLLGGTVVVFARRGRATS